MPDLLSIGDLTRDSATGLIASARRLKAELKAARAQRRRPRPLLDGFGLAMIFEKPSLRTRCAFEMSMFELGGHAVNLQATEIGRLGERESISDLARNLDRWFQVVQARVFSHQGVTELARWCDVPVVNGLSDLEHPTQILADFQTMEEQLGTLEGAHLAWVGDGNNVCRSLMKMTALLGTTMTMAIPAGYEPSAAFFDECEKLAPGARKRLHLVRDPREAVAKADVIYTDVWTSMGQEAEREKRIRDFAGIQVNDGLLKAAPAKAIVLHDMPAKRGQEITDSVLDGPRCRAFDQAENRLHAIKAILCWSLGVSTE